MFDETIDRRRVLGIIGILGLSGSAALAKEAVGFAGGGSGSSPAKEVIKNPTEEGQRIVSDILSAVDFQGQISATQSEQLQKSQGKTADQVMIELLSTARDLARPPVSNFRVGAVIRGASGSLYLGANLEIPGQSLGFTVHAEQAASANAYMHEEEAITAIAVTAAPCGHCRQFLEELSPGGDLNVLVKGQAPTRLKSLLPAAFGPKDLGFRQGAVPVNRVHIAFPKGQSDPVTTAALSAACASYAPYTKAHSGVAIRLSDGSIYSGAYIENAAFNPSLPPLQVALISILSARRTFEQIADVVLVELEGAAISQKPTTEVVLASICQKVRLRVAVGRMES